MKKMFQILGCIKEIFTRLSATWRIYQDRFKKACRILGCIGAILICLPVTWRIYQGDKFNPVSFFLWGALTVICTLTLVRAKKGGQTMMLGFIVSDIVIGTSALIKGGQLVFGNFEKFIVVLTILCSLLYVWCEYKKNLTPAVILNATACIVAGIPQMLDMINNPNQVSMWICIGYTAIAAISYYGEQNTLNARLLPASSVVYWIIVISMVLVKR